MKCIFFGLILLTVLPGTLSAQDQAAATFDELVSSVEIEATPSDDLAGMIEQLYKKSASQDLDVKNLLELELETARKNPRSVDTAQAAELFKDDIPQIEVERINLADAKRHYRVPSIMDLAEGRAELVLEDPKEDLLADWKVARKGGGWIISRNEDPQSLLEVRVGMILGEYGRVTSVWDSQNELYVTLEGGRKIEG